MTNRSTPLVLFCAIWQQPEYFTEEGDDQYTYSSSSRYSEFSIDLYVYYYYTQKNGDKTSFVRTTSSYKSFRQRCDDLTKEKTISWSIISSMLSQTNIPYHLQPFFIQQIAMRVRDIVRDRNRLVVPIIVELIVGPHELGMEGEYWDGFGFEFEALAGEQCAICLEEIVQEGYAVSTCLPCSHTYHQICIQNWFEKSNLCPLCRFEVPLETA